MKKSLFLLTVMLSLCLCHPALAQLDRAIELYSSQDYRSAVRYLVAITRNEPDNALAHFYLGQCYAQTSRASQAIDEFQLCEQLAPHAPEAAKCRTAIQSLRNAKSGASSQTNSAQGVRQYDVDAKIDQQSRELENHISDDARNRLSIKVAELKKRITDIRRDTERRISDVPKVIYVGTREYPNPDHPGEVRALTAEMESKIKPLDAEILRVQRQMADSEEKRVSAARSASRGLHQQLRSNGGDIKPTSTGTNLYVRNYANFTGGGPPEEIIVTPQRAQAQSFPKKPNASTKAKPNK